MDKLCFATFACTLRETMLKKASDEKITDLLLRPVIDGGDVRSALGDSYAVSAKIANKLLRREAELYSGIREASGNADVIEGMAEYFDRSVLELVNENRRLDLLEQMRRLIENDVTISAGKKAELLANADDYHLAGFLADVFLYALGKQNKERTDGRKKSSGQSTQLAAVVDAINAMPEAAVPRLVEFLMSTVYAVDDGERERFRDFKDAAFRDAVQGLLRSGKMTYRELYRTNNFFEIAALADEILREEGRAAFAEPVKLDFDWFFRFFEAASGISDEDMRELWAKVLAGEIERQGSFSLRTVEVLRNMTAREAEVFRRVSRLVLSETDGVQFLLCDDSIGDCNINEWHGLGTGDLFLLEECGLVNAFCISNIMELSEGAGGFVSGDGQMLLIQPKGKKQREFHYKSYPLTRAAVQLLPIVRDGEYDDYLIDLGRLLKEEQGEQFKITLHDVTGAVSGGEVALDLEYDYLAD